MREYLTYSNTVPVATVGTSNANHTIYSSIAEGTFRTVTASDIATIIGSSGDADCYRLTSRGWKPIKIKLNGRVMTAEIMPYDKDDPFDELYESGEEDPEMNEWLDSLKAKEAVPDSD